MPRALDPKATFDVVLESDKQKPEASRPTFVFRVLNGRQWKQLAGLNDRLENAGDGPRRIDLIFDAIRIGLMDWRGMIDPASGAEIPFAAADLDLLLDGPEAWEVLGAMLRNGRVTPDDKKKSELQP